MRGILTIVPLLIAAAPALAQHFPERPDGREHFVTDSAHLLTPSDEEAVDGVCRELLEEHDVPLIVVTVPTYRSWWSGGIEDATRRLFDAWGIGTPDRNLGILLLVSTADRKARIELGADWGRDHDSDGAYVMDDLLIPLFKQGDFSGGIREAVAGLDAMARGQPAPSSRRPFPWALAGLIGVAGIAGAAAIWSVVKSPSRRFGSRFGRKRDPNRRFRVRPYHGWRHKQAMRDRRNAIQASHGYGFGDGFGSGGGSFGGGFSGGGGATGGW